MTTQKIVGCSVTYVHRSCVKATEPLELIESAMFGETFRLVTRVRLPYLMHVWYIEIWYLKSNISTLNNCSSYRNVFQDGVQVLSKLALKTRLFVKKNKILCGLHETSFAPACGPNAYQIINGET